MKSHMRTLLEYSIVLGLFLLFSTPVLSEDVQLAQIAPLRCNDHETMVQRLKQQYQEQQLSLAIDKHGQLIEIFISKKKSWTILKTNTAGRSCVMDSGEDWIFFPMGEKA